MGIDIHGLYCLLYARKFGAFGETITLGRQKISVSDAQLGSRFRGTVPKCGDYSERMLMDHLGASSVESVDYSGYEGASVLQDMNLPMSPEVGRFDTVIEFGTVEHVFNIPQALANVRRLCRVGGQILHMSPADNFCGHGFWQVSPEVFFSLYSERNGFGQTEIFLARRDQPTAWYRVDAPRPGRRIPLRTRSKTVVVCRTVLSRMVDPADVQQSDYVVEWAGADERFGAESWLYRHVHYKYFRGVSRFNPHLTKVSISRLLA